MPSGYTAIIGERDDVTFNEFAWLCARGFGALILMRDSATDAPIPKRFLPSDYHEKELTEAKQRLAAAEAMSPEEAEQQADETYRSAMDRYKARESKRSVLAARYEAMIAQAERWQPPTPDHEEFKRFMIEQLRESLKWDCGSPGDPPPRLSGEQYRVEEIRQAHRDIEYHTRHYADELKRTDERNAWVDALRQSVGNPPRECEPSR